MNQEQGLNLDLILDQRERSYIESIDDPVLQNTVFCSISTYRHEDQLFVGDPVPEMEVLDINSKKAINLSGKRNKPLILFFGSYT